MEEKPLRRVFLTPARTLTAGRTTGCNVLTLFTLETLVLKTFNLARLPTSYMERGILTREPQSSGEWATAWLGSSTRHNYLPIIAPLPSFATLTIGIRNRLSRSDVRCRKSPSGPGITRKPVLAHDEVALGTLPIMKPCIFPRQRLGTHPRLLPCPAPKVKNNALLGKYNDWSLART